MRVYEIINERKKMIQTVTKEGDKSFYQVMKIQKPFLFSDVAWIDVKNILKRHKSTYTTLHAERIYEEYRKSTKEEVVEYLLFCGESSG